MKRICDPFTVSLGMRHFRWWLTLLILLFTGNVWSGDCPGGHHNIDFGANCENTDQTWECTYAFSPTDSLVDTDGVRIAAGVSGSEISGAAWAYSKESGTCGTQNLCSNTGNTPQECLGISIDTADVSGTDVPHDRVLLNGTVVGSEGHKGCFNLQATRASDDKTCSRQYKFHITSNGGGWGDPHIKTVDGVRYDFQSAGEFIALRGNGVEIQTRQTAVSTPNISFRNEYTGLRSCVSRYSAVAARVGTHRVTIQPKLSGEPDPSGPQIRVDGELKTLGPDGIDLSSCDCPDAEIKSAGRIERAADEQSIEIHYANGTKVVVVPRWWEPPQQTWFFNVEIYDTTATEGIMGLTKDDWLPALSDVTTLGPKATDLHERYVQLYETFADSWRVNDETSLFDYADGSSTATFTLDEWPRHEPDSCLLEGEPIAEPVDIAVAEGACGDVVDENNRDNCIFDVSATGYNGFADAYVRSEQLIPGATRTTLIQDENTSKPGATVTFTATVQRTVFTIGKVTSGKVQFVLDGKNAGDPMEFDTNGNAVWSTTNFTNGSHEVEAKFLPTGFGERFRSSSDKVTHVVAKDGSDKWWLSFHAGSTVPSGDFSDVYDSSYSAALDLEYRFAPTYSFLGLLGYNHFEGARIGVDDTYWVNLSANIKYYFYRFTDLGSAWVNAGAGAYQPESGSIRAGANIGAGFGGDINHRLRWEIGVNYHNIFTDGGDTQFTATQIGVTYDY